MLMVRHSREYMEGLVGPIRHFYKLYHWDRNDIDDYIHGVILKNATTFHPRSLVVTSLMDRKFKVKQHGRNFEVIFDQKEGHLYGQ